MKNDKEQSAASDSSTEQQPPPTLVAWAVRGISLLLILGLIGFFAWSALQPRVEPVFDLNILTDKIEQRGEQWVLPVEVTNQGSMSVHTLSVNANLDGPDGELVESHVVPLIGPAETLTLVFWFNEDPRNRQPRLSISSYQLP